MEVMGLLHQAGASLELRDANRKTALYLAAEQGQVRQALRVEAVSLADDVQGGACLLTASFCCCGGVSPPLQLAAVEQLIRWGAKLAYSVITGCRKVSK